MNSPPGYNPNPTPVGVTVRQAVWLFFLIAAGWLFWRFLELPYATNADVLAFGVFVFFGFVVALAIDLCTRF